MLRQSRRRLSVLTRPRWRVAVVGGGVTGCALAARLAQHPFFAPSNGRGLLLIDRHDVLGCDFSAASQRVFMLTRSSRNFLELPRTVPRQVPVRGMQVWRDSDAFFLDLPFEQPGCVAEQNTILAHLQSRLAGGAVQMRVAEEVRAVRVEAGQPCILAVEGEEHEFDLVVSAEGGGSKLAQQLHIREQIIRQHQRAIVARLRVSRPSSLAYQKFFREEVIGLLPQEDDRLSLVWSVAEPYHDRLMAMSDADFVAELEGKLAHNDVRQPDFVVPPTVLALESRRQSFALNTRWLSRPVHEGLVFVGDAAHSIHPMLGQGLNIGLAECARLAEAVEGALAAGDGLAGVGSVFARGATQRFHALKTFVELLRAAYYPSAPRLRAAVGLGIAAVNRSQRLREAIIACAN